MSAPSELDFPRSPLGWLPFLWNRVLFTGTPDFNTRVRWWSLFFVIALPAVLLYPCRDFLLLEPDEGRYAQIPREMLESGNWVVPTLQGKPYLDKPPLMYWLTTLSFSAFGVNEAAARLVPAVCVHLTILLVYLIGRRSIGERGAFWAAMLLTVSPGYLAVARLLLLDGLLTLCVTASVLCGFEAVRTRFRNQTADGTPETDSDSSNCELPSANCQLRWGWWMAAAVCSGLGFLTKGPISEILLFPPLMAFAWLSGSTARIPRSAVLLFAAIVVAVNLPWYVAIYREQPEFLGYFFWEHNVMRFLQPFDHLQPVWYYVPILLGGFLPGVIVGIASVRALLRTREERFSEASLNGSFWLLSGLWCVFFFSCSGSKLPTYILPAFPPLCLALGEYIARSRWNTAWRTRVLLGSFAALIGALHYVGLPWYANARSPMGRPELVEPYLQMPDAVIVTYPRNVDSVAFYSGRADLSRIRTTDLNQMFVDSHFRPKTVVLFTHAHSLAAFREAMPSSLTITESVSLQRSTGLGAMADKLAGKTPWGLCDIAVIVPTNGVQPR